MSTNRGGDIIGSFALMFIIGFLVSTCISFPHGLWKGIIGEAIGEGYDGMYAVASVYRNRQKAGLSRGCVACELEDLNEFVNKQPKRYHKVAQGIVWDVFMWRKKDITGGATHYENIEQYGIPYWAKDMEITVKIGNHTFYKAK